MVAVAALVPVYSHFHRHHDGITAATNTQTNPADARAAVDDTVLMNQIDSELSEEVPDALRPLAVYPSVLVTRDECGVGSGRYPGQAAGPYARIPPC